MATYKVPRRLFVVHEIPCKNVMGKCNKKALTQLIVDRNIWCLNHWVGYLVRAMRIYGYQIEDETLGERKIGDVCEWWNA